MNTLVNALVCGGGGFIGGHLAARLAKNAHLVRAVDIKPVPRWYQRPPSDVSSPICLDLSQAENCQRMCEDVGVVYQLAADMGGIGHIEQNRVDCMRNVLINTNMLKAAYRAGVNRYFFASSACVYNTTLQRYLTSPALKESDAYPAMSERGYGWEKLYSEMLAQEYWAERGMKTFIARFHNVYGPYGTWFGGREKAPAAICRKIIACKYEGVDHIEIWGDGTQARSYMWIGDCIQGILKIIGCDNLIATPVNLGSSEMVTVNELVDLVEKIAGVKVKHRRYVMDAPKGVAGRNSDNTFIKEKLGWEPSTPLLAGLTETYQWIEEQYLAKKDGKKVVQ